jgi:hypothetical protein
VKKQASKCTGLQVHTSSMADCFLPVLWIRKFFSLSLSDPDPTLTLILDLDYEKYIRNLDHLNIATKPDCLEKLI